MNWTPLKARGVRLSPPKWASTGQNWLVSALNRAMAEMVADEIEGMVSANYTMSNDEWKRWEAKLVRARRDGFSFPFVVGPPA